ncbi:MAG: hydantoinase/oxoprolinase family protein [Rhodospirillales bacterium]|nr:hydantoinase/oxoprolinase family protein [Rhodospirillales bacterium]
MKSVGVDIGGTFTDLVGLQGDEIIVGKTSTVVDDPTKGVANCLEGANADLAEVGEFLHGSTIAINTVLERKGAVTALLTTKGFRDVYAIGRSNRPEGFNLEFKRPQPLIPRNLSFEVAERLNAKGEILTPLDDGAIEALAAALLDSEIEAIAVCFLHSYANPAHEQRAGEILRRICPDLFVTLSSDILREYREYERTSTTALNAYVGPRVAHYLDRLDSYLSQGNFGGNFQIMRSNGGTMSLAQARSQPVSMMESGPVAGMIGAGHLAQILGFDQCIGFDMGGTTAKSSMFRDGRPAVHEEYYIGGYASGQPMQLPVVDIIEIGAGGGSLAWCDAHGGIHVGPHSAGADPGPACYGKGGEFPSVTDADLILGRLNPKRFLSGKMGLDTALAERAITEKIARPLGLSVTDAALGITCITDNAMSLSVRAVSVARGSDPRDCAMIAFGGAGPLHALAIARDISIPTVVIPRFPGNFSALGMLLAPWRQDFIRTYVAELADVDEPSAAAIMNDLSEIAEHQLALENIGKSSAEFQFAADLRYVGQEHTIPVGYASAADLATGGSSVLKEAYNVAHTTRYGHAAPNERIQMANIRLTVTAAKDSASVSEWLTKPFEPEGATAEESREIIFDDPAVSEKARILWRPAMAAGTVVEGPAVIEEPNSTTLLYPGDRMEVSEHGHLIIQTGANQ